MMTTVETYFKIKHPDIKDIPFTTVNCFSCKKTLFLGDAIVDLPSEYTYCKNCMQEQHIHTIAEIQMFLLQKVLNELNIIYYDDDEEENKIWFNSIEDECAFTDEDGNFYFSTKSRPLNLIEVVNQILLEYITQNYT